MPTSPVDAVRIDELVIARFSRAEFEEMRKTNAAGDRACRLSMRRVRFRREMPVSGLAG